MSIGVEAIETSSPIIGGKDGLQKLLDKLLKKDQSSFSVPVCRKLFRFLSINVFFAFLRVVLHLFLFRVKLVWLVADGSLLYLRYEFSLALTAR